MYEKNKTHHSGIVLYSDGGARGNPGPSAWAFVAKKSGHIVAQGSEYLGSQTNNVAEYHGVIAALSWAVRHREELQFPLSVCLDSLLVVQQLKGLYKIKQKHLVTLWQHAKELEKQITQPIVYSHIPRAYNSDADALVNQTLDRIASKSS